MKECSTITSKCPNGRLRSFLAAEKLKVAEGLDGGEGGEGGDEAQDDLIFMGVGFSATFLKWHDKSTVL